MLPHTVTSDLDMAIDPDDACKFTAVCRELAHRGYFPVQCLNYARGSNYIVFAWFDGFELRTVALDVISEHRRSGLVLCRGPELIRERHYCGGFWAAAPETEFSYLLAKKVLKGSIKPRQELRLKELAEALGRPRAEQLAGRLFGTRAAGEVVRLCLAGEGRAIIRRFHSQLWFTVFLRNPQKAISSWLSEVPRVYRRWQCPSGLLLAVMGVDGAGKSTLLAELGRQAANCFRRQLSLHWHPTLRGGNPPNTDPHGQPVRGSALSVVYLLMHLLDCWTAYALQVRPVLARSGLVLFDRYFHDVLVDPKRYRYGGPMAIARAICALCPKPHLVLALDASESIVRARKDEVSEEERSRQRQQYLALANRLPNPSVIDAGRPLIEVAAAANSVVVQHLALRLSATQSEFCHTAVPKSIGGVQLDGVPTLRQAVTQMTGGCAIGAIQRGGKSTFTVDSPQPQPASAPIRRHSFAILRWKSRPRVMLPTENRCVFRAGIDAYAPFALHAKLLTSVVKQISGLGIQRWARQSLDVVSGGPLALESLVAERTGEPCPVFSLVFGKPMRYPKLIAQAMRPNGDILGYAKLPHSPESNLSIRREAATLNRLENFPAMRPHLPAVRWAQEWGDGYILFQSPAKGRSAPARFTASHQAFLDTMQSLAPELRRGETIVDEVAAAWQETEISMDAEWRRLGRIALAFSHLELKGSTVQCGLTHGDFAPWNIRIAGGQLSVFDWESATWSLPCIWDRFHFDVQTGSLLRSREPKPAPESLGLFILYLAYSASALVRDGQRLDVPELRYRQHLLRRVFGLGRRSEGGR
jgi:thymidylate kinase